MAKGLFALSGSPFPFCYLSEKSTLAQIISRI